MQTMLIDLIPILLFLFAFKVGGIYAATAVGIVATALQVIVTRYVRKKFDKQQLITLLVFVVFGGMTLYFHNPIFIKWKPSIVFWIFSVIFLLSRFIGAKPLAQRMLESMLEENAAAVPIVVWRRLNVAWAAFFLGLGTLNLYVAYHFSTESWVNFKVYGILGFVFVFSVVQAICLTRYVSTERKVNSQ